jgi:hypothetical protein
MKKILPLLFFFSILIFSYASVQKNLEVSTFLYCKHGICSDYNEINTRLYFEDTFRVSTTAQVLSPENANPNDLPDGATICPGEVTLHSDIKSYFAQDSYWKAKMSVAVKDTSGYEDYTTVNRKEFEYSKSEYENWYDRGNVPQQNPFSYIAEPVTFSAHEGQDEFPNKKGYAGGAIKAKNIFSAGGTTEQYFEGGSVKWTTNLGQGSYDLSSQLEIEGVTIGLTRTGGYLRTAFYSFTGDSREFSASVSKATIHIDVVNANNIEMKLVSREPQDPVPIPTDMTIVVKNEGEVPIKVTDASITSGYSISKISGFNEEIPVGNEHQLKVHIDKTNDQPPSSATITLKYQSVRPTCDGQVKTKDLNFAISTQQPKKPDLFPKITATLPVPFYEGSSAGIKIEDCNQFMKAGAHNSNYSIKTNDGQNIVREETVQVGPLQPGQCQPLYNAQVACTKNIIVTACVDVNNEVQEEDETNNCKTDTYSCSGEQPGGKNCTIIPYYAMFIPPSSKYFELLCGLVACSSADWKLEDLDEHVSASVNQYGATVYVDAEAPPQKGKLIADAKDSQGENYKCSSVIDIIESKCKDFV